MEIASSDIDMQKTSATTIIRKKYMLFPKNLKKTFVKYVVHTALDMGYFRLSQSVDMNVKIGVLSIKPTNNLI